MVLRKETQKKTMLFWQFFQSIASAFIFLMGAVNLQAAFYCYEEQSKSNASYFYVMSGSQNVMPPNLYLIIIIKCLAAWCRWSCLSTNLLCETAYQFVCWYPSMPCQRVVKNRLLLSSSVSPATDLTSCHNVPVSLFSERGQQMMTISF